MGGVLKIGMLGAAVVIAALTGCTQSDKVEGASGQPAPSVHIVASGDFGTSADAAEVLRGMGASGADVALALGDLGYGSGEQVWCDFVTENTGGTVPFQLLGGNHDEYGHPDGDIEAYAQCLPNAIDSTAGRYGSEYVMDLPSAEQPLVRLVMASPEIRFEDGIWRYADGDSHEEWLRESIRQARQAGTRWVIVAAHKPCPTIGVHECETEPFALAAIEEGADLVLNGHEHAYLRTHQLGSDDCTGLAEGAPAPGCVVDSGSDFAAGDGTVMATVGTGGKDIRPVRPDDPAAAYFAAWSSADQPSWGYLDLQLDDTQLSARFVTTSGSPLTDSFVITAG